MKWLIAFSIICWKKAKDLAIIISQSLTDTFTLQDFSKPGVQKPKFMHSFVIEDKEKPANVHIWGAGDYVCHHRVIKKTNLRHETYFIQDR